MAGAAGLFLFNDASNPEHHAIFLMRPIVLVIVFFAFAFCARAQVVLTDNTRGEVVPALYHFRTTDNKLDILNVSNELFELLETRSVSLGYDRGIHWFRFDVINRSERTNWFLEVGSPLLDHVEFYSVDASGNWSLQYSGDLYKISTRAVLHRNLVFPFYMRSGVKETFYLKVVSTSALQVPVTVWSPDGLRDHTYLTQFQHGMFYGVMFIMIAYHLFLFFSIRDRTIIFYVITLIAGTNVIAYYHGYGFFFLNPEWPELNKVIGAFASPFFIMASSALARSFLDLKRMNFWLDRILLAIAWVAVIFALLIIGLEDYISYLPVRLLALTNFLAILISTIYCFKGYRPARFFLLAWGSVLVLGVFLLLRNLGLIAGGWLLDNGLYLSAVAQALLISFAFGDRINILRRENLEAKERELKREHQEKERLEREVLLRTEEIRQKNAQLEESIATKNMLFSIVSHDLRGPLISLQGILDMVELNTLSPGDVKKFTGKVGERLHHTADFLDNLLQWSRMQMQGETFNIKAEMHPLKHVLVVATQVLRADAERKNISLSIDAGADLEFYGDQNMIMTVVRNLVSNAIKFTHPDGKVTVSATKADGFVSVRISDTGIGIPEANMEKLFTLHGVTVKGTQLEKGTGLGLAVCKEFVERNGGTIKVESKVGSGTTFEFTIPAGS
jgi:signal transduction histidine kinase